MAKNKKDLMKMTPEEITEMEEKLALEQIKELEEKQAKEAKSKEVEEVIAPTKAVVVLPKAYQRWLGPVYAFTLNGKLFALKVDGSENEVDPAYKNWIDDKIARVLQSVQREDRTEQL